VECQLYGTACVVTTIHFRRIMVCLLKSHRAYTTQDTLMTSMFSVNVIMYVPVDFETFICIVHSPRENSDSTKETDLRLFHDAALSSSAQIM